MPRTAKEAYREGAAGLKALGFNGIDVFQLELPHATNRTFNLAEEEKIVEVMKDKNMTARKLPNLGPTMVNAGVVMKAHKREWIKETEEKSMKEEEVMLAGLNGLDLAVYYWRE